MLLVGLRLGPFDGLLIGACDGLLLGAGLLVGILDGAVEGFKLSLGEWLVSSVGANVGTTLACAIGFVIGANEGNAVGSSTFWLSVAFFGFVPQGFFTSVFSSPSMLCEISCIPPPVITGES
jgi:hypothetical protein